MEPNDQIVQCPICLAPCIAHPGHPPSQEPRNFFNRCPNGPLSGHPGKGNRSASSARSYHFPQRRKTGYCGAPLTTMQGQIINPLPWNEYMSFTRHEFNVKELVAQTFPSQDLQRIALSN